MTETYKKAGVDIDAGNQAVERMKTHVRKTFRPEVRTDLGGFGSLFALQNKYEQPILVSGTDGVGTKLKIAFEMDRHDTIGQDLVAMCVNDILVQGAESLFFLDYIATGKLVPEKVEDIVKGISTGCLLAGCSLIGGETAEMPGMYQADDYDLAGFAVGVVEEKDLIDGSKIESGDLIIGLESSGLHSNGYSLVRHLLTNNSYSLQDNIPELGGVLGEQLLIPTKIYVRSIMSLLKEINILGMAHITGGGLLENIPRILPEGLQAEIELGSWEKPAIFNFLQKLGNLDIGEMYRTFNMGIGFTIIIKQEDKERALNKLEHLGEKPYLIGGITEGNNGVLLLGEDAK